MLERNTKISLPGYVSQKIIISLGEKVVTHYTYLGGGGLGGGGFGGGGLFVFISKNCKQNSDDLY